MSNQAREQTKPWHFLTPPQKLKMLPSMLENIWINLLFKNRQITYYVDPQMTRIPESGLEAIILQKKTFYSE